MEYCDIFLSYSRKDIIAVKQIKQEIEQSVKTKCWMDLEGIPYDSPDFTKVIAPAIENASIFIFILTEDSQNSRYAKNELMLAEARDKHIIFIEPFPCELSSHFILAYGHHNRNHFYIDYEKEKLYAEIIKYLNSCQRQLEKDGPIPMPEIFYDDGFV